MNTDKISYLHLTIPDELPKTLIDNQPFFRISNLESQQPLVQINNLTFQCSYNDAVCTNIFFKRKLKNSSPMDHFTKSSSEQLEFVCKQSKILACKVVVLDSFDSNEKEFSSESTTNIMQLHREHEEVWTQFVKGRLHLNNPFDNDTVESDEHELFTSNVATDADNVGKRTKLPTPALNELDVKYEKLKKMARRPVRRKRQEDFAHCPSDYRTNFEFDNLLRRTLAGATTDSFVDIDRCVLHGLLEPSNEPNRQLTSEERSKIFTFENFDNLSIEARFFVLNNALSYKTSSRESLDPLFKTLYEITKKIEGILSASTITQFTHQSDNSEFLVMPKRSSCDLVGDHSNVIHMDEWSLVKNVEDSDE